MDGHDAAFPLNRLHMERRFFHRQIPPFRLHYSNRNLALFPKYRIRPRQLYIGRLGLARVVDASAVTKLTGRPGEAGGVLPPTGTGQERTSHNPRVYLAGVKISGVWLEGTDSRCSSSLIPVW